MSCEVTHAEEKGSLASTSHLAIISNNSIPIVLKEVRQIVQDNRKEPTMVVLQWTYRVIGVAPTSISKTVVAVGLPHPTNSSTTGPSHAQEWKR